MEKPAGTNTGATELENIELAIIDTEKFTDEEAWRLLELKGDSIVFESIEDVTGFSNLLIRHRPALAQKVAKLLFAGKR